MPLASLSGLLTTSGNLMSQWNFIPQNLSKRKQDGLYRSRHLLESQQGCHIRVNGRDLLSFCSNDYLDLAGDPRLVAAAQQAMEQCGLGGGASHLVIGHHQFHHQLEQDLAAFTGRQRALCFSTGYMANLGVVAALLDRHSLVLEDKLNHASLLDAGKLAGCRLERYLHGNVNALAERLRNSAGRRTLVVTDGVFSMDGDVAPLNEMVSLCRQNDAMLMVDDAHGFGVLGAEGGGCAEEYGLTQEQLPVLVGTLGKAFGTFGAFVAGSEELIETLIQFARTYIYTTAMPPAVAAATRTSLQILRHESWRRNRLNNLIDRFRREAGRLGYDLMPSATPIQPVLVGDSKAAMKLSERLYEAGILVSAIRPPTVPQGSARLRITFSAGHTENDLDNLLQVLAAAGP